MKRKSTKSKGGGMALLGLGALGAIAAYFALSGDEETPPATDATNVLPNNSVQGTGILAKPTNMIDTWLGTTTGNTGINPYDQSKLPVTQRSSSIDIIVAAAPGRTAAMYKDYELNFLQLWASAIVDKKANFTVKNGLFKTATGTFLRKV